MGDVKVKDAWSEVGTHMSGLGERLKEHFGNPAAPAGETVEDAAGGIGEAATAVGDVVDRGEATMGEAADSARAATSDTGAADAVKTALKHLGEALDGVVEAIGGAAKDPAVTEEVRQVGQSLVNALSVTFTDASGEIRRAFNRNRSGEAESTVEDVTSTDVTSTDVTREPPIQPSGE